MDQHTQHRTIMEYHSPYLTGDRKWPVHFQICSWMLGLIVTASFVVHVGAEGEAYAPQWGKSVPRGENCSITEVPSETCVITFDFFTEITEIDCNNVRVDVSDKCVFNSGHFQPDPCYGLTLFMGEIWKQNIRAPFAFCAEKRCFPFPTVFESGVISLFFSTHSGSATTATSTWSTTRQTDQGTVKETTADIGPTNIALLAESSAWKYALILPSIVLLLLLLTLVYYRRRVSNFLITCRAERSPSLPPDGRPDETRHMLEYYMKSSDHVRTSNSTVVKFTASQKCHDSQQGDYKEEKLSTLSRMEAQRLNTYLKQIYTTRYKDIKTCSPLDPNEWMELDRIFTNLALLLGNTHTKKQPLEFKKLLGMLTSGKQTERVILLGEAGVGKTSLLSKIAYDWARGRCLADINLLFVVPLREVHHNQNFGDYLLDELELGGSRIDEYIRSNQKKVLILFDGLDEHKGELRDVGSDDAIIRILRVEKFVYTPIVVTTRPWRAEQITSSIKLNRLYKLVEVEGFKKKDVYQYIGKFFGEDKDSAQSLIDLIKNDSVVSENMAPFPIFCNMLCYMWRNESKRETMQRLKTFSQLLYEMVYFLEEHSCARMGEGVSFEDYHVMITVSFKEVGKVAFNGLLEKTIVFEEDAFESCQDALINTCEVGVLTREKRFVRQVTEQRRVVNHVEDIRFPHKLLQEYLAGFYLASLHQTNPVQFNRFLNEKLLVHYKEFRYLFYFTAAQGKAVGSDLMEALCKNVHNLDFIIDTTFECHDTDALSSVVALLRKQSSLHINGDRTNAHTASGYMFVLPACNQYVKKESKQISSNASGISLFMLPNLRSLKLEALSLEDDWFGGIYSVAASSQNSRH